MARIPSSVPALPVAVAKGSRKNNFTFSYADASCLAVLPKRCNISIFPRFGALPGRRLIA
jgi:hypothetical protein